MLNVLSIVIGQANQFYTRVHNILCCRYVGFLCGCITCLTVDTSPSVLTIYKCQVST